MNDRGESMHLSWQLHFNGDVKAWIALLDADYHRDQVQIVAMARDDLAISQMCLRNAR